MDLASLLEGIGGVAKDVMALALIVAFGAIVTFTGERVVRMWSANGRHKPHA
jgi:hypothetical protein